MVLGAELSNNPMFTFGTDYNSLQIEGSSSIHGDMEVKNGKLKLHLPRDHNNQSQRVVLKLYAAVPYPFAVVFPDKFVCLKHCGLVQLKNFSIEIDSDTDFTIVTKNDMEGGKLLRFSVDSCEERESWVNAFHNLSSTTQNSCSNKSRQNKNIRLPSLEEVSEEDERQEERAVLKSCDNVLGDSTNRRRPLTPRRRVVEVPALAQISEEEENESDTEEMDFENRIISNSHRRTSLKDCLSSVITSRGGRSL